MTRKPARSIRSMCASARSWSPASQGTEPPADRAVAARAIIAGAAPFTKHRTTGRPSASVVALNVAMSLIVASNGRVASRGSRSRVASMSRPALWPSTSSAPSVGSPTTFPSTSWASLATM